MGILRLVKTGRFLRILKLLRLGHASQVSPHHNDAIADRLSRAADAVCPTLIPPHTNATRRSVLDMWQDNTLQAGCQFTRGGIVPMKVQYKLLANYNTNCPNELQVGNFARFKW